MPVWSIRQNIQILHKRRKINCKPVEEKAKSTQELKSMNFKSSDFSTNVEKRQKKTLCLL